MHEFDIDLSEPANLNQTPLSEQETRRRFLNYARSIGKDKELLLVWAKYDRLLKQCKDEKELEGMREYACLEVYEVLGKGDKEYDKLYVNNKLIYTGSFLK